MEVTIVPKKETSQAEIKVSVPASEFKLYIEKAAKKLSTDHSIKGFRPGKAPVATVAEMFGADKLMHEAMDMALPYFFVQAALDNGIEAINRPAITVEELGMDVPFRFTAMVDVLPEVKLPDLKTLKAEKREVKVDEELITKELNHLAKMRSTYLEVARPAQDGDTVTVDFTVKMNGEIMEGGTSQNHPITIGEGAFVPDFEKGLLGMVVGDTRTYPISFPEDFANLDLRGKKAEVEVKAHAVQQRMIPELNDDFAKKVGRFENLQNLKDELTKNLLEELKHKEEERHHGELAEKLSEGSTFGHIPDILVEKEIDSRMEELSQLLAYQGKSMDEYINQQKKSMAAVREEMKEAALKNVKVGLAMRAFAAEQEVLVTDEEIEDKANQHLALYKTMPQAKANVNLEELKERVGSTLRNQKTLQKLAEMAGK